MHKKIVLDTSALLAWIHQEPGGEFVADSLKADCYLSNVNLIELVAKLIDQQYKSADQMGEKLRNLNLNLVDLNERQAITAAMLRKITINKGLSLGDRACLALAIELDAKVLTTDKVWTELKLPIDIINIRNI
jgi:ribonuclease VapC